MLALPGTKSLSGVSRRIMRMFAVLLCTLAPCPGNGPAAGTPASSVGAAEPARGHQVLRHGGRRRGRAAEPVRRAAAARPAAEAAAEQPAACAGQPAAARRSAVRRTGVRPSCGHGTHPGGEARGLTRGEGDRPRGAARG